MSVYVDASAILKLYVEEDESDTARLVLDGTDRWTSARHTLVEVRRNLPRLVVGTALEDRLREFRAHWAEVSIVELVDTVCERAAAIAELTGVKTMDALHLGAAGEAGADDGLPIVTFDRRLAAAARSLGWRVLPE